MECQPLRIILPNKSHSVKSSLPDGIGPTFSVLFVIHLLPEATKRNSLLTAISLSMMMRNWTECKPVAMADPVQSLCPLANSVDPLEWKPESNRSLMGLTGKWADMIHDTVFNENVFSWETQKEMMTQDFKYHQTFYVANLPQCFICPPFILWWCKVERLHHKA